MTWTTCKDWTDKDHENFLMLKAKEWYALIGKLTDHDNRSWGMADADAERDIADEQCWAWLLIWASWRAGDRG